MQSSSIIVIATIALTSLVSGTPFVPGFNTGIGHWGIPFFTASNNQLVDANALNANSHLNTVQASNFNRDRINANQFAATNVGSNLNTLNKAAAANNNVVALRRRGLIGVPFTGFNSGFNSAFGGTGLNTGIGGIGGIGGLGVGSGLGNWGTPIFAANNNQFANVNALNANNNLNTVQASNFNRDRINANQFAATNADNNLNTANVAAAANNNVIAG